jgi:hypothetical protein
LMAWVKHVLLRGAGRVKGNSSSKECDMGHASGASETLGTLSRTSRRVALGLALIAVLGGAAGAGVSGCAADGVRGDDGLPSSTGTGPDAAEAPTFDADPSKPCSMTGGWIAELHTVSTALSADQKATNWFYFHIQQTGDRFTIDKALHCGFIVAGTTSVTLADATTKALATGEYAGPNRQGTFKASADGKTCSFALDRMYNIRGAKKSQFLTDVWKVGDPPKALSAFPTLPKTPAAGMENWDGDTKSDGTPLDGITLKTGLGDRYVAQRDWNEHAGTVPAFANQFGGPSGASMIVVKWDSQEAVSDQTGIFLRTGATPKGDGWSRFARADGRLTVVEGGADGDLKTCKNVQQLARSIWPQ